MLSAQQAAWGATDPLRVKFTKEEKKEWSKEDKKMYKMCYDLHGVEKATYTLRKQFAKRKALADGVEEPVKEKPAAKKEPPPLVLINDSKLRATGTAGKLVVGGTVDWDTVTSNKGEPLYPSMWGFHRVFDKVNICYVATGTASCHTIAISPDGQAYSWGRNKHGQLGQGHLVSQLYPEPIDIPGNAPIAEAACGRKHTILMSRAGDLFGCGSNNEHQLGLTGSGARFTQATLAKGMVENVSMSVQKLSTWGGAVTRVACGAEFSVAVDCEGQMAVWGKPEYGQLGNGTNGEFIAKANKIDYNFIEQPQLRSIRSASGCSQVADVACGNNHTLALMADGSVFTWGFGGYGRLGHQDGADQMTPKQLADLGPSTHTRRQGTGVKMISAGSMCSFALTQGGVCYFWGTNRPSAEAVMFPKPLTDLSGWGITSISCGNSSTIVAADNSTISWGPSPTYGELGYGNPDDNPKSSTKAKLVDSMEGAKVHMVAVGYGHCAMIADPSDQISALPCFEEVYADALAAQVEKNKSTKTAGKKRKAAGAPSEE